MDIAQANAAKMETMQARLPGARLKVTGWAKLAGVSRTTLWRAIKEPAKASFETMDALEAALVKAEKKAEKKLAA